MIWRPPGGWARRCSTEAVNINETSNYWDQLAPFGGAGKSGVGRELSQWFLDTFTEPKLLVFDLGDAEHHDRRAEGGW